MIEAISKLIVVILTVIFCLGIAILRLAAETWIFRLCWAYAISQVFGYPELSLYQGLAWVILLNFIVPNSKNDSYNKISNLINKDKKDV